MGSLFVKDWRKLQHYRHAKPAWLKLHRDFEQHMQALPEIQRYYLLRVWLMAAKNKGEIPDDPDVIQKELGLEGKPDLQAMVDAGALQMELPCDLEEWRKEVEAPKEKKKRAKPKRVAAPYKEIYAEWNRMAKKHHLPMVHVITQGRKIKMDARWKNGWFREHWKEAIAAVPLNEFHLGSKGAGNGWQANIDWFLRPDKAAQLLEAKAAQKPKPRAVHGDLATRKAEEELSAKLEDS